MTTMHFEEWDDPKTLEELEEYATYSDFDMTIEGNDLKFSRYGETVITLPDYKKNAALYSFINGPIDGVEFVFTIRTLGCVISLGDGKFSISGKGFDIDLPFRKEWKDGINAE